MAVCVRLAAREMDAMQVAFVRFAGSFLVLLVASGGRDLRPSPGVGPRLALRALLGATAIVFYYLGIRDIGAGPATMLHCTYPVFATLFSVLFMEEAFTGRLAGALAMNLGGAALVMGAGARLGAHALAGGLASASAAVLAGGAIATARSLRVTESATRITVAFMAVGALLTAPSLGRGLPPASAALVVALVGVVFSSVGGQWLLHHGLGFTTAAQGSLAAATAVVTAAVLEAIVVGQWPPARTALAAALMVAAVGLAASDPRQRMPVATDVD